MYISIFFNSRVKFINDNLSNALKSKDFDLEHNWQKKHFKTFAFFANTFDKKSWMWRDVSVRIYMVWPLNSNLYAEKDNWR